MHSLAAKRDLGSAQSDADRQRRRLTNPHKLPFRGVVSEDWPPEMRPKSNPPVGAGRSCRRLHPPTAPYRDRVRPRRHLECYRPSLAPKCRVAQRSNPGTAVRSHSRWACPCQYSLLSARAVRAMDILKPLFGLGSRKITMDQVRMSRVYRSMHGRPAPDRNSVEQAAHADSGKRPASTQASPLQPRHVSAARSIAQAPGRRTCTRGDSRLPAAVAP